MDLSLDNYPLFSTGHESSRRKVISVKILQSNILPTTVEARGVAGEGKEQKWQAYCAPAQMLKTGVREFFLSFFFQIRVRLLSDVPKVPYILRNFSLWMVKKMTVL